MSPIPGQLNPSPRLLLGPGPSDAHPRVLAAMTTPLLGKLCHEFDCLLLVDAVTSLGCVPVNVDEWEIDAAYSCSQKGLGCPPGLSPVSFSQRAVDAIQRRKTRVQSWYLDLTLLAKYW